MKGLGKFLVGGILGAIFGFLVSPRRAQRVRDALFGRSLSGGHQSPVRVAISPAVPQVRPSPSVEAEMAPPAPEAVVAEPEAVWTPPASAPLFAPPAPATEPEPEREVAPEPAAAAEPEAGWAPPVLAWTPFVVAAPLPPSPESIAEDPLVVFEPVEAAEIPPAPEPAPRVEPAREAPPALASEPELPPVLEVVPAPATEPAPKVPGVSLDTAGLGLRPGIHIQRAPEVLEEPVEGSGWTDALAAIPSAEAIFEDLEPLPPVGAAAESVESAESEAVATFGAAAPLADDPSPPAPGPALDRTDLRARIDDTRERIRRELELSFTTRASEPTAAEAAPQSEPPAAGPVPEPAPVARTADGGFDQEAMRRRIDETRNRLKAKAFDAMMSGDAALLSRDSGTQRPSSAPEVPLDSEVAETIEKTLTEEDL